MNKPRPTYAVPADAVEVEYEIKKSRFIARVAKAADREAAMAVLAKAREDYPDARHHCWAYLIGNPHSPTTVAMSDDGEPSGTAGKPILNVLQHKDVGDLMLVVIRYFGGIKLGAGGLVRAYSHSAQLAMTELSTEDQVPYSHCNLAGDYALEQPLRHWLGQHQGKVESVDYGEQVRFAVSVPDEALESLRAFIEGLGASWLSPN